MLTTDAWVLYEGSSAGERGSLHRGAIPVPDITEDEALVEPLFGAWEANMSHAIDRRPIDVCRVRDDEAVVLGNAGVVRVIEAGSAVDHVTPGDTCMFLPGAGLDAYGYMVTAHAYDAPGTIGLLARTTKVKGHNLAPLPRSTGFSLPQWAAFSCRYMTAWSNWSVAYKCFRSQLSEDDLKSLHVWGWGGGSTLAELELAQLSGCTTVMLSGSDRNIERLEKTGISAVDRRAFPNLAFDERRYADDPDYREAYRTSESRFLAEVAERTDGQGVSIFIDYIGSPVTRATAKALSRLGVLTTAGWKLGMMTSFNRAIECIARHIHVHTHFARLSEAAPAMAYAEEHGWMPSLEGERVYRFDDIPQLVSDYTDGRAGYFPIYAVNPA